MSSLLRAGMAALALSIAGCPSTQPPPPLPPDPPDPEQSQQELLDAVSQLEAAEADGQLDPRECNQLEAAFLALHDPREPTTAAGPFDAGVLRERCGQPERAAELYRLAIATDPKHAGAHNNLGILRWRAGDHAEAFAAFERAVEADPQLPMARNNLSEALRERYVGAGRSNDFDRAELALRNALAVDSDSAIAHENLARLYYDRGRSHDRSYLLLSGLVITRGLRVLEDQGRDSAELHNLQGLLLMEEDDPVLALRAFEEAARIDPDYAQAHLNIAMIALRFRDFDTAETSLDAAREDPRFREDMEVLLATAVARRGLRRYDEAKEVLLRAERLASEDPRPLYNLGILMQEHIGPEQSTTIDAEGAASFDDGPLLDARDYFERFANTAADRYPEEAADARARISSIDQFLQDVKDLEALEAELAQMEALARTQQEEERQRLLELERRAKEAAGRGSEGGA